MSKLKKNEEQLETRYLLFSGLVLEDEFSPSRIMYYCLIFFTFYFLVFIRLHARYCSIVFSFCMHFPSNEEDRERPRSRRHAKEMIFGNGMLSLSLNYTHHHYTC